MKRLIILALLLCSTSLAHATTWYIRLDGGNNIRCAGTTNAPDPGSGTGQACAFNHPYQMLTYTGTWAHLTAGDTVQFADPSGNTTPYNMGEQNGGIGFDWGGAGGSGPLGGICPPPNSTYPSGSGCILPPPPDNTTWIGQNAGSCHTPGHTGLVTPTVLSATGGVFSVLDLQGTNGVTLSCIEVTQPDNCTTQGVGSGGGCANTANYVAFGGIILEYLTAQGPRNLTMTDVAVDGTASAGVLGSHLNTLSSDVITGSDIYLIGNGGAGWNSDGGGCNTSCESIGTMNLTHLDVEGNGCLLLKPFDVSMGLTGGSNAFNYCFGQNTSGYGDGFVLIAAGNFTVNVNQSTFKYNTQDGFDALHISDDNTTSPITNITNSWSEGNGGAAFKLGAGSSASAISNVGIANCHVLTQSATFPNNPSGWIVLDYGDSCRAAGDQWSFQLKNGSTLTLENNSMAGYGTTMLELGCASGQPSCGANGATVTETNDAHIGYPDSGNAGRLASGWNLEAGVPMPALDHNSWFNMDSGCPDSAITGETNPICGNPLWVGQSNVDALNPNLTSSSSLISAGSSSICPDADGVGEPQTSPCTIGARVYVSGTSTVAQPIAAPPAGPYGPSQMVALSTPTPSASIIVTTDTSDPAVTALTCTPTNGTLYTGPLNITTTTTVKALGCLAAENASTILTALYTINGAASAPTFSGSPPTITLATSTSGCTGSLVWNTTNAQTGGNLTGTSATNPITVASSETIYAQVQGCTGWSNSSITSAAYVISQFIINGVIMEGVAVR